MIYIHRYYRNIEFNLFYTSNRLYHNTTRIRQNVQNYGIIFEYQQERKEKLFKSLAAVKRRCKFKS